MSERGMPQLKYAEKEEIPILMEIPFQREIAEAYSRGKLIIEILPEWKDRFIDLFEKIRNLSEKN